jgi:hypothetical protein
MLELLDYVQRSVNHTNGDWSWDYKGHEEIITKLQDLEKYECTPQDDLDFFETTLKFDAPEYKQSITGYRFELNEQYINEQYGSDVYTLRTYSFINYIEEIGFPFILPGIVYGNNATRQSIKRLQKFNLNLSIITLIRAKDVKSIENIFSRRIISNINNEDVNALFSFLLKILKMSRKGIKNDELQSKMNITISIITVLPGILGRLCIKASILLRKELLILLKSIYVSEDRYKYGELANLMKHLMESFSNDEQYELVNCFLDFPILQDNFKNKFPDPFYFIDLNKARKTKQIQVNVSKINEAIEFIKKNDSIREKAIIRLLVLWRYQLLTSVQMEKFAMGLWKYTNNDGFPEGAASNYYYSAFLWFPHPKNINPQIILRRYIATIKLPVQSTEKDEGITMTYGHIKLLGNIIGTFNSKSNYKWSQDELHLLIDKILNWWNNDKKYLERNSENKRRSESIRNEFKFRFNNMLSIFACIFQPNISNIMTTHINKIIPILLELNKYGIPDIMARASFVKGFPSLLKNTINDICSGLYSKDEEIISDAIAGTMVIIRQKSKGINRIIHDISQNIKYRTDVELYRFLSIMNSIVCDYSEYVNKIILENIEFGLQKLITETILDKESTDKETHTRQINRACHIFCVNEKYHQNGTRSFPNSMANWFNACPQSLIGIVHFSEALRIAR